MRASRFTYDLVFGDESGTRAVFEVATIAGSFSISQQVQAVVQLPEAAAAAIDSRRGEQLTFTGELVRCDAFARNLFVADGELLDAE